jgi:hypothetical protein
LGAKDRRFEVLLMCDETRFGGDQFRTGLMMQDLADNGCDLVYYFSDELVVVATAVDKFLVAARNFASELERERSANVCTRSPRRTRAQANQPGASVCSKQHATIRRRGRHGGD